MLSGRFLSNSADRNRVYPGIPNVCTKCSYQDLRKTVTLRTLRLSSVQFPRATVKFPRATVQFPRAYCPFPRATVQFPRAYCPVSSSYCLVPRATVQFLELLSNIFQCPFKGTVEKRFFGTLFFC